MVFLTQNYIFQNATPYFHCYYCVNYTYPLSYCCKQWGGVVQNI